MLIAIEYCMSTLLWLLFQYYFTKLHRFWWKILMNFHGAKQRWWWLTRVCWQAWDLRARCKWYGIRDWDCTGFVWDGVNYNNLCSAMLRICDQSIAGNSLMFSLLLSSARQCPGILCISQCPTSKKLPGTQRNRWFQTDIPYHMLSSQQWKLKWKKEE